MTINVKQRFARLAFTIEGSALAGDSVELLTGEQREISAFAADAHGYTMLDAPVPTLSSSDPSVASLVSGSNDADAPALFLVAGTPGLTNVIATLSTPDTTLVDTARVSVIMPPPVATVEMAPHGVRGVVGGVIEMAATVAAASGRILWDRRVTWSSSDEAIATVDTVPGSRSQLATVTGHGPGIATITATSEGQAASETVGFDVVTYSTHGLGAHCGLSISGAAYCWGEGSYGSLGDSSTLSNPTPVAVRQGDLTFAALSAGGQHTCALTGSGVAYCWGLNVYGELGTGQNAGCVNYQDGACRTLTPKAVAGGLTFSTIEAGGLHTCALTAGGDAYCWGHNAYGETGNGLTDGVTYTPTLVQTTMRFTSISARYGETCGVIADGSAYCWGDNGYGQLGDGTTISRSTPAAVSGGLRFSVVRAGGGFACGLTLGDGLAYCWGVDQFGQLGSDAGPCDAYWDLMPCSPTPVAVPGSHSFVSIALGGGLSGQVCGLTAAGDEYCWGYNGEGQLGTGVIDQASHEIPALVAGGHHFTALATDWLTTCGLATDGAVYCWGMIPAPPGPTAAAVSPVPVKLVGQP